MAFTPRLPAPSGKHRRPRRVRAGAAALAGVAVLSGAGAFGANAMASPGQADPAPAPVRDTAFTRAPDVSDSLAHTLAAQADAQREAADAAQARADQARKAAQKAQAEAKAQARAEARARAKAAAKAKAAAAAKAAAETKARAAAAAKAATAATRDTLTGASRSTARTALPVDSGYMKPVGDAAIGTGYKASGSLWSSGSHTGVDFLVGSGTPVHAVAAGTVVSAGADGAYGNDVIIKHADGMYTLYGHLTQPLVSAGQTVTEGQEIGVSGATGNVTGPHLHFEVRTTPDYGSDLDPVAYLASHGVTI
ncbi:MULTISPECIES: M23 family metallopeptidase [unclassified Streptomyces]|uniref:M23 family metallopeptidase n=1 Tax=unclassified Streptomyces TaxID=2593676 RepID=UPI002E2DF0FD|nr:M23 family metallopeptidase [Streptomyces sp. NBC_00223]